MYGSLKKIVGALSLPLFSYSWSNATCTFGETLDDQEQTPPWNTITDNL